MHKVILFARSYFLRLDEFVIILVFFSSGFVVQSESAQLSEDDCADVEGKSRDGRIGCLDTDCHGWSASDENLTTDRWSMTGR